MKLEGTEINGFKILGLEERNKKKYVLVSCPYCGEKTWKRLDRIQDGTTKSCGCQSKNKQFKAMDLAGKKFNRLTAISPTPKRLGNGAVVWLCKCECGNTCEVSATDLTKERVRSCGCLGREVAKENGKRLGEYSKENFCIEGTRVDNLKSKKIPKHNTSGIKGVFWDKTRDKWCAQIAFKGKNYHLGRYDNKDDAAKARKEAEDNLFGNFLDWYAVTYPERWEKLQKKEGRKADVDEPSGGR